MYNKNYNRGGEIKQKREGLDNRKEWVNSAFNEKATKIITKKIIFEQRPKGSEESAREITGV